MRIFFIRFIYLFNKRFFRIYVLEVGCVVVYWLKDLSVIRRYIYSFLFFLGYGVFICLFILGFCKINCDVNIFLFYFIVGRA